MDGNNIKLFRDNVVSLNGMVGRQLPTTFVNYLLGLKGLNVLLNLLDYQHKQSGTK